MVEQNLPIIITDETNLPQEIIIGLVKVLILTVKNLVILVRFSVSLSGGTKVAQGAVNNGTATEVSHGESS